MERADFLKLCQKVSTFSTMGGVINDIPENMLVEYATSVFYPVGYKLTFTNGKARHTAILHDLKANSEIECQLYKVKLWKE